MPLSVTRVWPSFSPSSWVNSPTLAIAASVTLVPSRSSHNRPGRFCNCSSPSSPPCQRTARNCLPVGVPISSTSAPSDRTAASAWLASAGVAIRFLAGGGLRRVGTSAEACLTAPVAGRLLVPSVEWGPVVAGRDFAVAGVAAGGASSADSGSGGAAIASAAAIAMIAVHSNNGSRRITAKTPGKLPRIRPRRHARAVGESRGNRLLASMRL